MKNIIIVFAFLLVALLKSETANANSCETDYGCHKGTCYAGCGDDSWCLIKAPNSQFGMYFCKTKEDCAKRKCNGCKFSCRKDYLS